MTSSGNPPSAPRPVSSAPSPSRTGARPTTAVRTWVLACGLALSLAMLLWLKLRVVTGVPRSAYADPETKQPQQPKSPTATP